MPEKFKEGEPEKPDSLPLMLFAPAWDSNWYILADVDIPE